MYWLKPIIISIIEDDYMFTSFIYIFIFLAGFSLIFAQKIYQYEEHLSGQVFLTDSIAIPFENAGYTLLLPDDNDVLGLIIFFSSNRDPAQYAIEPNLEYYALNNKVGLMYVTTGNRLEFFFKKEKLQQVDKYIHDAQLKYNLPTENIFFAGMSLSGTRAVKFALYSAMDDSSFHIMPAAIGVCDAPLDFIRFWKEAVKARDLNYHPLVANEGAWVSGYL